MASELQQGSMESNRRGGGATRRLWVLLGLVAAFGWPYLLLGRSPSLADVHNDLLVIVSEWIVVTILVLIGFGVLKRDAVFFGLRLATGRDIFAMVGMLVATYIVTGIVTRFFPVQTSMLDIQHLAAVPFVVKLALVLTAGICEEFMFRGFAIEELADWTGSIWLGALITWLAFILAHIGRYGLTSGLVIPAVAGGTLTLLYVWRRNLPVCMFMHAFIDGLSIFLLPVLMKGHH